MVFGRRKAQVPSPPPLVAAKALTEAPALPPSSFARGSRDSVDWFIALTCICAGIAGLRTVNDPVLWSQLSSSASDSRTIGTLVKKKGGVRFRSVSSPLWHDVYTGTEQVAAGDTVFTGDDGQAELVLQDGSRAEIEPNSLIVVQLGSEAEAGPQGWLGNFFNSKKSGSMLQIEKGSARLDLAQSQSALKLRVKGKTLKLSGAGASAQVSVDAAGKAAAKIASLSGEGLEVSGEDGSPLTIGKGQQALIDGKAGAGRMAVQTLAMTPVRPTASERVVVRPGKQVGFSWKWSGSGEASSQGRLEIEPVGKGGAAAPALTAVDGKAERADVGLDGGSYRWRLAAEGAKKGARTETAWQVFSVTRLAPPTPRGPLQGAWVPAPKTESQVEISFSWDAPDDGLKTELEWALKPQAQAADGFDGVQGGHEISTDSDGWQAKLEPGAYQWRLRAEPAEGSGDPSDWSPVMSFTVGGETERAASGGKDPASVVMAPAEPAPPVPQPVAQAAPEPVAKVAKPPKRKPMRVLAISSVKGSTKLSDTDRLDQILVPLRWEALSDAKQYDVSVTDDATGTVILKKTTRSPLLNLGLHSLRSVRFSYQVTAVISTGEKVKSAPVPFEIQLSAPVLKTPPDGANVEANKQGTILVTWERTVLTDSYRVQISQDPSFRKKVREETATRNLLTLRGLTPNVSYYWRVQSLSGGHKSEWSQASLFVLE